MSMRFERGFLEMGYNVQGAGFRVQGQELV